MTGSTFASSRASKPAANNHHGSGRLRAGWARLGRARFALAFAAVCLLSATLVEQGTAPLPFLLGGVQLEVLKEEHGVATPISVNVSASLLSRTDWLERLDTRWFQHGLQVEVTERALVADVSVASETLQILRGMGARIYIDDFGTGYSSLSYLHRLPLDAIKIDRSFVDSLVEDEKSRALVRGLVALGRGMGCDLVAEGIETEQQLEELRSLDVDCGQGYLFARPMPASELLDSLRSRPLPETD